MQTLPYKRDELSKLSRVEIFEAIVVRRVVLRTHRDQVGDDRCWADDYLLFAFVEGLESKITKPSFEAGMELCREFYNHCKLDNELPSTKNTLVNPGSLNSDLWGISYIQLLAKLETIQLEIVILYNIVKRRPSSPNVKDYLRLYRRTLPEGIMPDMRLPSEKDFLGQVKKSGCPQKSIGCPQFWRSHSNCPPDLCDLHQWGPCSQK